MSKRILIVYNPKAGRRPHEDILREIKKELAQEHHVDYLNITEYELLDQVYDHDIIVAVGGDGTVNSVAKRLQYGTIPLGIIPAGSGDGLARHLGIPKNVPKAIEIILHGRTALIDSGDLSGHFFVNIAGTGFEAEIAHRFGTSSGRGISGYIKTIMETFRSHRESEVELIIENQKHAVKYFSLSIANGSQWGNNFKVASAADLQDSQFEIAIMRKPKWYQIPRLVKQLLGEDQVESNLMSYHKASEIFVGSSSRHWHIDGEPIVLEDKNRISCLPNSVSVILPV